MSKSKSFIKRLIEEEVKKHLFEQEEDASTDDIPDSSELDASGTDDTNLDLGSEDSSGDLDLGSAGDDGMDLSGTGDLGGEEGFGDEADDTGGGGFSGGGFSGGGGGFDFGDSGDTGMEPDEAGEEEFASTVGPEDVEMPTDPIMSITDDAIKMLNQTRDPGQILKNTKASIQKYFNDADEATPVIKSLWDTEDLVLRDVARRLLLFIKGI